MTEAIKLASTDTAAKRRGAIKGGLIGLGLNLFIVALAVGLRAEPDWTPLFAFGMLFVVIGAALGWVLPAIVAREREQEARRGLRWQKSAALGFLAGVAFWALIVHADESLAVIVVAGIFFGTTGAFLFSGFYVFLVHSAELRRKTLKFLGLSLGAVVGLYLVVLAINIPDEDLLPEAKKILDSRGFTVKPEENAYFAFAGFDAPKGEDPYAFGRKRVAFWEEQERRKYRERNFDEKALYGGAPRRADVALVELVKICDWNKGGCLETLGKNRDAVDRAAAASQEWLDRYQALLKLPKFEDFVSADSSTPIVFYSNAFGVQRLRYAQCAVLVHDGKTADCLAILAEDIALARRMLAGSRTLFGKLNAAAALKREYSVLAEVIAARPDAARQAAPLIAELLTPLTQEEMDISSALMKEFLWLSRVYEGMRSKDYNLASLYRGRGDVEEPGILDRAGSALALPLFQTNASANYYYRWLSVLIEHARLPADRFVAEKPAIQEKLNAVQPAMYFPAVLYNPVGKLMHAAATSDLSDHKSHIYDLDGQQRLLRLQWKIVEQKVPVEKVAEFVKSAGAEFHDPYTGQPMAWDEKTRTLSFVGHAQRPTETGRPRYQVGL